MARETVSDLREEIRDLLRVPQYARGETSLKSRTLTEAAEAIGCEDIWGGAPSVRQQIRQRLEQIESDGDLVAVHQVDAKPLRRDELEQLRDALEERTAETRAMPDGGVRQAARPSDHARLRWTMRSGNTEMSISEAWDDSEPLPRSAHGQLSADEIRYHAATHTVILRSDIQLTTVLCAQHLSGDPRKAVEQLNGGGES